MGWSIIQFDPPRAAMPSPPSSSRMAAGVSPACHRPDLQNLLVLVMGALLAPGKRTASACLRMTGRADATNFTVYHQVLNRGRWKGRALARTPQQLTLLVLGVYLAALVVSLGAGAVLARTLTRPINALISGARAIGEDNRVLSFPWLQGR